MSRASDHAYKALRVGILNGEFPPGTQLKEESLAERFGVSRTPVRAAVRRLETEMFVRRTDSQRSYVADWSASDVEDVFTLRAMLEGHAAYRAATNMTEQHLERLHANTLETKLAVNRDNPDIDAFLRLNTEFHGLILSSVGSVRLSALLKPLILQPIVERTTLLYDKHQLMQSLVEHEEAVSAFRSRDAEWASAVLKVHILRAFHVYRVNMADASQQGRGAEFTEKAAQEPRRPSGIDRERRASLPPRGDPRLGRR